MWTIKNRILLFVILLQVLGYSLLIYVNKQSSDFILLNVRQNQINAVFSGSITKIDSLTRLMEKNVSVLALAGSHFYSVKKDIPETDISAYIESFLIKNFRQFPQSIGGGLWYEPFVFDPAKRFFGPYVFWQNDDVIFSWELNTPEYNYHQQDWYQLALPDNLNRTQLPEKTIYWTEPYVDEAGSETLMMTVDAYMTDEKDNIIGLATVDWAMTEMTNFVEQITVTQNSFPFLIDKTSEKFVSFPKDQSVVMSSATINKWSASILASAMKHNVGISENVILNDQLHTIYYSETEIGLVFGIIIPNSDFLAETKASTQQNLALAILLSAILIITVVIALHLLFKPFDKVLTLIKRSIKYDDEETVMEVTPIRYLGKNEFSPIIKALNKVYKQINEYTQLINNQNQVLQAKHNEVEELNTSLEIKVNLRTAELEKKTRQVTESLETLAATKEKMIDIEKHAALGQLVAGIAHEINTPLGVSVTAVSNFKDEVTKLQNDFKDNKLTKSSFKSATKKMIENSDILMKNINRAAELIASFKQVSVDQSSEFCRQFNLYQHLSDLKLTLKPQLIENSHSIKITCKKSITINSYPGALSQVLTNLVMNSLIHGFEGVDKGVITIDATENDGQTHLIYADNGVGMSAETEKKIFEPFYTTKRAKGGTGLGMHIVYNIVTQKLKGHISCKSEIGGGTNFFIEFPSTLTE